MDESIRSNLSDTRQKLLENFDTEVHDKLIFNKREGEAYLSTYNRWLWDVTRYYLGDNANFSEEEYSFSLKRNPFAGEPIEPGPYKIGKNIDDAHIYRPGHSLAQRILNEVKSKEVVDAELTFDYSSSSSKISVLEPYIGKAGVLKVSNFTVSAFENEDNIIVSGFDESNNPIESDIIKRIFSLPASVISPTLISDNERQMLTELEQQFITFVSNKITERNGDFFDDEVEKLDSWSEDVKKGLELDLKKLDIDIKFAKTVAKKVINLEQKLKAQREIKDSEKKRNEMRRRLYEAQDDVDVKKDKLLETIEAQLHQKSKTEPLFTIRWKIV